MYRSEKISLMRLSLLIFFVSIFDTLGIASILPFFSIASDINIIYENKFLFFFYDKYNFNNENNFLIFVGILSIVIFSLSTFSRVYSQICIFNFSYFFEYGLTNRILNKTLSKDYEYFISKHSSEFTEKILSRVEQLISGFILPLIFIISCLISSFIILIFLFSIDFRLTLALTIFIGSFYYLITITLSGYIKALGKTRLVNHKKKFKLISEMMNGIKELKLFSVSDIFKKDFSKVSFDYAIAQSRAKAISNLPKLFIELILIITVITIILFNLVVTKETLISIVSYLSVYALAAYKLMPSLQLIFNQNVMMRYNKPLLDELYRDYDYLVKHNHNKTNLNFIEINDFIELRGVKFSYPESNKNALNDINVVFQIDKSIALVGTSGSGKSTLLEVLVGLLKINKGKILIDNKEVSDKNSNIWNSNFSVVPQTVYILDDTVIANIAFGMNANSISFERVKFAAKVACLQELIEDQMPEKYNTILGERGIKLSGGQRKRIAIARAIYRESKFIVFDEATSELDSQTERKILSNIKKFKTGGIISIAHRISTIKNFDEIILVKNGKLLKKGSYEDLIEFHDFKKLT